MPYICNRCKAIYTHAPPCRTCYPTFPKTAEEALREQRGRNRERWYRRDEDEPGEEEGRDGLCD